MSIDASLIISIVSAVIALLSLRQARRMSKLTELALQRQFYEKTETLPSVEALGVVEAGGKKRAMLIIFNHRETSFRVHCVKCYSYNPKRRNFSNWIRSQFDSFDWDYSLNNESWNPKGDLDNEEHYAQETIPFTLVKEKEILLVTLSDFAQYKKYRFEVITSQGTTSWEGVLPNGRSSLPYEYSREIV